MGDDKDSGPMCMCGKGKTLADDGVSCEDKADAPYDPCADKMCEHGCMRSMPGSYYDEDSGYTTDCEEYPNEYGCDIPVAMCLCKPGFSLMDDDMVKTDETIRPYGTDGESYCFFKRWLGFAN